MRRVCLLKRRLVCLLIIPEYVCGCGCAYGCRQSIGIAYMNEALNRLGMAEKQGTSLDKIKAVGPAPATVPKSSSSAVRHGLSSARIARVAGPAGSSPHTSSSSSARTSSSSTTSKASVSSSSTQPTTAGKQVLVIPKKKPLDSTYPSSGKAMGEGDSAMRSASSASAHTSSATSNPPSSDGGESAMNITSSNHQTAHDTKANHRGSSVWVG